MGVESCFEREDVWAELDRLLNADSAGNSCPSSPTGQAAARMKRGRRHSDEPNTQVDRVHLVVARQKQTSQTTSLCSQAKSHGVEDSRLDQMYSDSSAAHSDGRTQSFSVDSGS